MHPELQGAVRSTTVWVESQLVTDGKVVTGSWCRMCCSRELSRSSVTPGCTLGCTVQYTRHCTHCTPWTPGPHLGPVVAATLPPLSSSPPHTRHDISQWRPQHLSISAKPPSGSVLVGSQAKRNHLDFLSETSIWLCGNSLLSNQLCIIPLCKLTVLLRRSNHKIQDLAGLKDF